MSRDIKKKAPPNITAHKLIANLCVEMANEIFEEIAPNNKIYGILKLAGRDHFIEHVAPTLKPAAIGILGSMLGDPKTSDKEKEIIYEALVLDKSLPKGGDSITHR